MGVPKFITLEDGFPAVADNLTDPAPNRLGVMAEFWKHSFAYDHRHAWHIVVDEVPVFSWLQRALARTVWNPRQRIQCEWKIRGEYAITEISDRIKRGLEKDDDIIQQWFDGDTVIWLLDAATDFDTMCTAVRAIHGEHETDPAVEEYVVRAHVTDRMRNR